MFIFIPYSIYECVSFGPKEDSLLWCVNVGTHFNWQSESKSLSTNLHSGASVALRYCLCLSAQKSSLEILEWLIETMQLFPTLFSQFRHKITSYLKRSYLTITRFKCRQSCATCAQHGNLILHLMRIYS